MKYQNCPNCNLPWFKLNNYDQIVKCNNCNLKFIFTIFSERKPMTLVMG